MGESIPAEALQCFRCFEEMPAEEINRGLAAMQLVSLAPGEVLFRQGDAGGDVYLLVTGKADVNAGSEGHQAHFATLEPGAILGEIGLLLEQPRTATVSAAEPCVFLCCSSEAFFTALDARQVWAEALLLNTPNTLAQRLVQTDRQIVSLIEAASPPQPRVAELEQLRFRLFTEWSF